MSQRQGMERRAYWEEVIQRQASSGLSVLAFCREHGVTEGSFYYWRRKLAATPVPAKAGRKEARLRPGRSVDKMTTKFVPVDIPASSGATRASCEVVLPDGCRLIVPTQCDAGWLREMLSVLGDWRC